MVLIAVAADGAVNSTVLKYATSVTMLGAMKVTLETSLSSLAIDGDSAEATDSPTEMADGLVLKTVSKELRMLENDEWEDSHDVMIEIADTKVVSDERRDEK